MLGPEWLGSAVSAIPLAGPQEDAARSLVAIGLDGSRAGTELAALHVSQPARGAAASKPASALVAASPHIDAALSSLSDAAGRVSGLKEGGLLPPLAEAVRSVKTALRDEAPFLGRARALVSLERYLRSSEHRVLLVSQDSAELMPTGGFAGSYGILDIGPAGVRLEAYKDVYTIPDPPGRVPPPPGVVMTTDFRFRDANWWIDFPTSARTMLRFWRTSGEPPVEGIVAIDVVTVRDLLAVFGPVRVPSYSETFTSQNLLDRLLYLVEVKGSASGNRKGVLTALAGVLEQRVLNAGPEALSRSALALARSADAKHVQLYFPDAKAQTAVTALGWSGALASPAGTTDLLAVSNAMYLGGKVNGAMRKTSDYRVALQPDGSADTTLVLDYSNTAPFALARSQFSIFGDYLRVYRAAGTLISKDVAHPARSRTLDLGLPAAVRTFTVRRGQTHRVTVVSRVPGAWSSRPAAPHYRLFIVRQADLQDVPTTITVTPPKGWRISGASAWLAASKEPLRTSLGEGQAELALPLSGDMVFDVRLARR